MELVGDVLVRRCDDFRHDLRGPDPGNGRLILGDNQTYELINGGNTFTGGVQFGLNAASASPTLRISAPYALPGAQVFDLKAGARSS